MSGLFLRILSHIEPLPPHHFYFGGGVRSRADYPALFEAIGDKYGGDGETTFCLPDLRPSQMCGHLTTATGAVCRMDTGELVLVLTYRAINDQLHTRDGRRIGNAVIESGDVRGWVVRTEYGNVVRFNEAELDEFFHPSQRPWTDTHSLPSTPPP